MILVIGCGGISRPAEPYPTPTPDPLDAVRLIAEERSKAEEWAKVLKSDWEKNTVEYEKGETLYIDAKASFDGWLDQLKLDIVADRTPEAGQYEASLKKAVEKSQTFTQYVQTLKYSSEKPMPQIRIGIGIDTIVEAIVGAGVKIWEAYRDADAERKQQIINVLNELKWKSFEEL